MIVAQLKILLHVCVKLFHFLILFQEWAYNAPDFHVYEMFSVIGCSIGSTDLVFLFLCLCFVFYEHLFQHCVKSYWAFFV